MTKSYDKSLKTALMMLFTMITLILTTEPALAVDIGGLAAKTESFFDSTNNIMIAVGTGIGVIGFTWAAIEYIVNKSPIVECAKILGAAVLIGGAVALIGAAVDFGKTI